MSTTDPTLTDAISDYALRLRRAHRHAGEPSLRVMAARMNATESRCGYHASASTLHRTFRGERLPAWPLVRALLIDGLGMLDKTIDSDWLPGWIEIRDRQAPISSSGTTARRPRRRQLKTVKDQVGMGTEYAGNGPRVR
jgi:hypothetical protein